VIHHNPIDGFQASLLIKLERLDWGSILDNKATVTPGAADYAIRGCLPWLDSRSCRRPRLAGQFKAPVYYPAPGLPVAVVAADFNHDGNLDLAVADFGNEVVETLLGRGDGSFRKGESISINVPLLPNRSGRGRLRR
jgi:hypothetical protein